MYRERWQTVRVDRQTDSDALCVVYLTRVITVQSNKHHCVGTVQTKRWDTRRRTDESKEGIGWRPQRVRRWRVEADCSEHEPRRPEKPGHRWWSWLWLWSVSNPAPSPNMPLPLTVPCKMVTNTKNTSNLEWIGVHAGEDISTQELKPLKHKHKMIHYQHATTDYNSDAK